MNYLEKLAGQLTESNIQLNQDELDNFWRFIHERQRIWYQRFVLGRSAPWTKDPILTDFKFTNVYRELDKGTMFLLDHIAERGTPEDQVWNTIVYRMFNRISTYEFLKWHSVSRWRNPENFRHYFDALRAWGLEGNALYTDAHMVCAYEHFPGDDKLARFEYIFQGVLDQLDTLMRVITKAKSLETVHSALTKFPGIGPFLAYEMAVDISYMSWNNLGEDEWTNPGPGCQRGLKDLFPGVKGTGDCQWLIKVLRQIQKKEWVRLKLPFEGIAYQNKELTLRNIEHCLCEYHKYWKAKNGKGRPRNRFNALSHPGSAEFKRLRG